MKKLDIFFLQTPGNSCSTVNMNIDCPYRVENYEYVFASEVW
jgi:hypothetical protein